MNRRGFTLGLLAAAGSRALAAPARRESDPDFLWREIDAHYAYFDPHRRRAWRDERERLRVAPRAADGAAPAAILEAAIERLRDDAVSLASAASPSRRVPYDLDIWPRHGGRAVVVESVRTFSDADVAGIHPGQTIVAIGRVPVNRAIRDRLGAAPASAQEAEWALRRLLAGARGNLAIEVSERGAARVLEVERVRPSNGTSPPILGRRMGGERDIGYIRVRVGNDERIASHFDGAMGHMAGTRALIVDLRETSAAGARATTLAILAHFARAPAAWQLRQAPGGPRLTDTVNPRAGAPYAQPVAVLVDRWTAGEGEALAAGLAAVAGARIVGTATAGIHGEPHERALPASGLVLRYPGERTFLVDGRPREALVPDVPVDPSAPSGGPGDPILYQALKLLERR